MMVEMIWSWYKVDLASIKEGSAVEVLIILIKTITPDFRDIGIQISAASHTHIMGQIAIIFTPQTTQTSTRTRAF
jgi:hypothetical protein